MSGAELLGSISTLHLWRRRATCGAAEVCSESTPYCSWMGDAGRCISRQEAERFKKQLDAQGTQSVLACTKPRDCGSGRACCGSTVYGVRATYCGTHCDPTNEVILCQSAADCPVFSRRRPRCLPLSQEDPEQAALAPPHVRVRDFSSGED